MARLARLYIPGMPQHVMLQTVASDVADGAFRDDDDLRRFVETLRMAAREHGFAIHAYALTPALIQLVGTPRDERSVARTIQAVGRRYVGPYNRRHRREGALWDGRYRATVIDPDAHLLFDSLLVEAAAEPALHQPAVQAALTQVFGGHAHAGALTDAAPRRSSYPHHAGLALDPLLTDHSHYWALGNTPFERQRKYRALGEQPLDAGRCHEALEAAYKGWIFGDQTFRQQCERLSSRRIAPLPRGRRPASCTSTAQPEDSTAKK